MVECKICGKEFGIITASHLKKHEMTVKEYKEKFGTEIVSLETIRAMKRNGSIDWDNIGLGAIPDSEIAVSLAVSKRKVCYERNTRSIPPFNGYLKTQEGYHCRSVYEAMYDAWLHWKDIQHEH